LGEKGQLAGYVQGNGAEQGERIVVEGEDRE